MLLHLFRKAFQHPLATSLQQGIKKSTNYYITVGISIVPSLKTMNKPVCPLQTTATM